MKNPPPSHYAKQIGFSESEREALRWRTEALLNGVLRIQRLSDPFLDAPSDVLQQNRIDLCSQAAKLIADICGDWVKLSEGDADTIPEYIALSLRTWQPVLAMHDEGDFWWDDIIDEIERLQFGDEPEIFVPAPRPPGSNRQPAKIASQRISALQWAKYLGTRGIKPYAYKRQISLAYGTDWEAIRKWRIAAEKLFGEDFVGRRLADAADGYGAAFIFPEYGNRLFRYGSAYREAIGLSLINFATFEAATMGKSSG